MCLDTLGKDEKGSLPLGIFFCQNGVSANQVFSWSKSYELRREDLCCAGQNSPGSQIIMYHCSGNTNERWNHTKSGHIVHINTGLCLDVTDVKNGEHPKLNHCNSNRPGQNWEFKNYAD
jgi:polypeptide N-acetylgalactosaminyltransferase